MSQQGSIRDSSQDSQFINRNSFQSYCKKLIRVSEKNRIIKDKLKLEEPLRSSISPETFEMQVKKQVDTERRRRTLTPGPSLFSPIEKKIIISQNSCLMWYLTNGKGCRNTITDYEMTSCKGLLKRMISEKPSEEGYFGLGKLMFHDECWKECQYYLNECLKYSKDPLSKQWYAFIVLMNAGHDHEQALSIKQLLEDIAKNSQSIENYWALMTLALTDSLKVRVEIEMPHFYATKIKQIDTYYGYLAFAKIFLCENNIGRAMNVLVELINNNPTRPEAYVLLWNVLYSEKKDYELAEDLMIQAFLRIFEAEYDSYITLFCINLAKAYARQKKYSYVFEILQQKYVEQPGYPVFLYQYGRNCAKAMDSSFLGSAIGALEECLRLCDEKRYGKIYFWLSQVYFQKGAYFECYVYTNLSLECPGIPISAKAARLRETQKNIKSYISKMEILYNLYRKNLDPVKCLAECEGCLDFDICRKIKAKLLWKSGNKDQSIKFLEWCIKDKKDSLRLYFLLARYLKKSKNIIGLNKLCKKMIKITQNTQVTTSEWMHSNVWYARTKALLHKPDKSLPLLQCLAKVFPPIPNYKIPYTHYLIHGKSANDFLSASQKALAYKDYEFSECISSVIIPAESGSMILEQHSPNTIKKRREITDDFIDESMDESSVEISSLMPPENERHYLVQKSFDVTMSRLSERGFISMGMTGGVPTGTPFIGFSVCSSIDFLYYIGKISFEHGLRYEDGLCAVQDFLVLTELERRAEKRARLQVKGMFIKSFLLMSIGKREQGRDLFMSIRSDLVKLKMHQKIELAQKYFSFL